MNKFGPSRGELWGRLVFSLAGLGLLSVAIGLRGIPDGPALVEVVGFGSVFFGGTAVWSAWRLFKTPKS